jgi:hypothetical protein
MKIAIDNGQETTQLLLNYRKDGTPFWNLLYVAPLRDEAGNIAFYLGGQIDCSTTIHGKPDIMKILELDDKKAFQAHRDDLAVNDTSNLTPTSPREQLKRHRQLFKSTSCLPTEVRRGPGMENDLIGWLGGMNLETQMQMFHTAYSKVAFSLHPHTRSDVLTLHVVCCAQNEGPRRLQRCTLLAFRR